MKYALLLLILLVPVSSAAQQPAPVKEDPQVTIANQAVEIAQLKAQIHELQLAVKLYENALGVSKQRADDQKAVEDAKLAFQQANAKAVNKK